MKRLIVVLMAALCALALSPSAAQAADPVAALKAQLVKNRGVTVVERATDKKRKAVLARTNLVVQLDRSGPVASDMTVMNYGGREPHRLREIFVDGRRYIQDGSELPDGKQWVLGLDKSEPAVGFLQAVNVLEPATLRALLKSATIVRRNGAETLYSGTISYGKLSKVSPTFRANALEELDGKKSLLNWRLWIDAKGLVRRMVTSSKTGFASDATLDTRFADWRSGVAVEAPPEGEVVKADELDE